MRITRTTAFLPFIVALTLAGPAGAGSRDASPWLKNFHSKTRLVAAKARNSDQAVLLMAGIHVGLDSGWKTYWRSPGDAGIPPHFDWSGSKNLKRATVLWPAPKRFADPAGSSIGYSHEVVLPVILEPESSARPIDLQLRLEYAICKEICAPAEAKMALTIVPAGLDKSAFTDLISRYMSRVPRLAHKDAHLLPRVRAFTANLGSPTPHIAVEAQFAPGSAEEDLFVEGPAELYLPMPKRVSTTPEGHVRFRVDLGGSGEAKALKGQSLTLTLVSDRGQSEARRTVP